MGKILLNRRTLLMAAPVLAVAACSRSTSGNLGAPAFIDGFMLVPKPPAQRISSTGTVAARSRSDVLLPLNSPRMREWL